MTRQPLHTHLERSFNPLDTQPSPARGAGDKPPSLLRMALVFLKVGATAFGGAMPMLAVVQSEVLDRRGWVRKDEFEEAVMVGQILPGPIAYDAVTYIGYRMRGVAGATVASLAFTTPGVLTMLLLTFVYLTYGQVPQLQGALRGLGAGVVAIVAAAVYRLARPLAGDRVALALAGIAMLGLVVFHANAVVVIVAAGLAGLLLYREQAVVGSARSKRGQG